MALTSRLQKRIIFKHFQNNNQDLNQRNENHLKIHHKFLKTFNNKTKYLLYSNNFSNFNKKIKY